MENATTVIFPVGDFTAAIARQVADSLDDAAAHGRSIVISLQWTARWSWDALCDLAESLQGRFRATHISFAQATPAGRSLLGEVGIGSAWFIDEAPTAATRRILISAP
jgi:hypothetical protein